MGRGKVLGWTLLALIAIVAFVVFGLASTHSQIGGRKAPALPREQLVGPPATLTSFLAGTHGRPAAIVFWASWCGPCKEEAPELERFSKSARGRGRIAGVDWSDALSGARSFIRRYAWSFPNTRDPEGTVGNAYGLVDLPTTFVLDSGGHIRAALRGQQTQHSLAVALAKVERS
jgi:cytochrome c biogenesis protein CcmG, thiol:disulfide interchange protein DsbE